MGHLELGLFPKKEIELDFLFTFGKLLKSS